MPIIEYIEARFGKIEHGWSAIPTGKARNGRIRHRIQSLDTAEVREYHVLNKGLNSDGARAQRTSRCNMEIDGEKLEQAVLALLYLNSFEKGEGKRAWKSFPWSVMDSLHEKGYISDPATKNKSVWLSEEGANLSEELFEKLFAVK